MYISLQFNLVKDMQCRCAICHSGDVATAWPLKMAVGSSCPLHAMTKMMFEVVAIYEMRIRQTYLGEWLAFVVFQPERAV